MKGAPNLLILTALRTQIKWILALFIVIFTLSIGFMYGTGSSRRSDGGRSGDFVVAKINGEELHISTLQEHLRSFVERNGIKDLSDKQIPIIYKAVFDEMIANRAIIDEVTRLKISAPAEEVNAQYKAVESQYVTKEAFMQMLKNNGSSIEQVKASIARQLAIEKMLDDAAGGAVVSDEEIQSLYDSLKPNLTLPAGIDVDFAQFKTKESAAAFLDAVKGGAEWDPSAAAAGEDLIRSTTLGTHERIAAREMSGKLEPVASLEDGQVSDVLEIDMNNYFVIRRVEAVPEEVRPLEEVSESLKTMLLESKKVDLQRNFVKELTDKMKIEVLTPDLFEVKEEAAPTVDTPMDAKAETATSETPAE